MIKTKLIVIIGIFILVSATQCFGQGVKQKNKGDAFRLNKSLPSIYLTFERKEEEKGKVDNEKKTFIWLRLHNNTRWRILLDMSGGVKPNETSLFYEILDENDVVIEEIICTVCSFNWLKSGKTIPFKIPIEFFKNSKAMRISYNYEWEDSPYSMRGQEPTHYVYFDTDFLAKEQ